MDACDKPDGAVTQAGDCDDADPARYPGNTEVSCDGVDNDCDAATPDEEDLDGDGVSQCDGDCDDDDAARYPGAPEVTCDGVDNDCDALTLDDDDFDGDGVKLCDGDCDDTNSAAYPGAPEICGNNVDESCSTVADDDCTLTHCGVIAADETWAAAYLHMVSCDVFVEGTAAPVLTIEDGAEVRFAASTRLLAGWADQGSLDVQGVSAGVLFTSDATSPARGDWGGIYLGADDQGSSLVGAAVEYGGGAGKAAVYGYLADPIVTDCTLRESGSAGFLGEGSFPLISGTTIENNALVGVDLDAQSGLARGAGSPSFVDNVISGNGGYAVRLPADYAGELGASSVFSGNTDDGVYLTADTVSVDASWQDLGVPFIGEAIVIEGAAAPHLIIEDGVEVQWTAGKGLLVGWFADGSLEVQGASAGVLFTSHAISPAPGDWGGIYIGANDQGSTLVGATVEYGGTSSTGPGLINSYNSGPVLTGCTLRNSASTGFSGDLSFPLITGTTVENNALVGVDLDAQSGLARGAGSPSFADNVISGNGGYAVRLPADYAGELDASSVFSGNADDGVYLTADTVTIDTSWQDLGVPFIGEAIAVEGSAAPHLIIEDGAELQWTGGKGLQVGWFAAGSLEVQGSTAGVLFTSAAAVPAAGDWNGIYIGAQDQGSTITGATVAYGGATGFADLYFYRSHASTIVTDSAFTDSSAWGIYREVANPSLTNITYANNVSGDLF